MDLVYLALIAGLFAVSALLVWGCARLRGRP